MCFCVKARSTAIEVLQVHAHPTSTVAGLLNGRKGRDRGQTGASQAFPPEIFDPREISWEILVLRVLCSHGGRGRDRPRPPLPHGRHGAGDRCIARLAIALPPAGRRTSHRKTTPRSSVTSLGSELSLEAADAAARPGEANWPVAVPRAAYAGTRARPAPVIVASSFL